MFGSKQAQQEPTLIGRGAVIEGKVRATGRVQVDGHVDGVLEVDGQVSIGPDGRVTARGHLHVLSSGRIEGDARYETLQVDRGAVIEGRTLHGEEVREASSGETGPRAVRPSTPAPVAIR
jgi:cytoskeletal protein CcmA (bactofilin family)